MSRSLLVVIVALAGLACITSAIEGPQLQAPPPQFGMHDDCQALTPGFEDWTRATRDGLPMGQRCYGLVREPPATITITAFEGPTTRDEVEAVVASQQQVDAQGYEYSDLTETVIDGRPAWGWMRVSEASRKYQAVVSHEDVTFLLDFYTADPKYFDEAFLASTVASFKRHPKGATHLTLTLVAGVLVVGAVIVWWLRKVEREIKEERERAAARGRAPPPQSG